jgi:uncharacterized protein YjbI with pentapeptide repeats
MSDNDFYFSSFLNAQLRNIDFSNCNIKKASFVFSRLENINFKNSNVQEALFEITGAFYG